MYSELSELLLLSITNEQSQNKQQKWDESLRIEKRGGMR